MDDHAGQAVNAESSAPTIAIQGLGVRVRGFCTTRHGGVSAKPFDSMNLGEHVGDELSCVQANRQLLTRLLPASPIWVNQVHGTRVLDARAMPAPIDRQADALVTSEPGQVLGILTADCLPVVMANDAGEVLALAHAGWRGLAGGVLDQALCAMQQHASERDRSLGVWRAWIGPCISAQAFQVGNDVREAFTSTNRALEKYFEADAAPHKWRCDLPGLARYRLLEMGATAVHWCGDCTVTDPQERFFSYRREGRTGRMATVAWLAPDDAQAIGR